MPPIEPAVGVAASATGRTAANMPCGPRATESIAKYYQIERWKCQKRRWYRPQADHPPYDRDSPWMSMPLAVGIDHVIMNLSLAPRSDPAINKIMKLTARYRLVLYDPQSDDAYLPADRPA